MLVITLLGITDLSAQGNNQILDYREDFPFECPNGMCLYVPSKIISPGMYGKAFIYVIITDGGKISNYGVDCLSLEDSLSENCIKYRNKEISFDNMANNKYSSIDYYPEYVKPIIMELYNYIKNFNCKSKPSEFEIKRKEWKMIVPIQINKRRVYKN